MIFAYFGYLLSHRFDVSLELVDFVARCIVGNMHVLELGDHAFSLGFDLFELGLSLVEGIDEYRLFSSEFVDYFLFLRAYMFVTVMDRLTPAYRQFIGEF